MISTQCKDPAVRRHAKRVELLMYELAADARESYPTAWERLANDSSTMDT